MQRDDHPGRNTPGRWTRLQAVGERARRDRLRDRGGGGNAHGGDGRGTSERSHGLTVTRRVSGRKSRPQRRAPQQSRPLCPRQNCSAETTLLRRRRAGRALQTRPRAPAARPQPTLAPAPFGPQPPRLIAPRRRASRRLIALNRASFQSSSLSAALQPTSTGTDRRARLSPSSHAGRTRAEGSALALPSAARLVVRSTS
jgi:hypothetical protein